MGIPPRVGETLAPPSRLPVDEWARRHRRIVSKDAARPGRWRSELAPHLDEPMALCQSGEVDVVVLSFAARCGKTEVSLNCAGAWVDQHPGPVLWVYPSEDSAKERVKNEVRPLFQKVKRLRRHLTGKRWDLSKGELSLTGCNIYVGWSGSPQALASRTIRYVVLDEIDKYPRFSGKDGSPVALAFRRTETYQHRKQILVVSTPTTRKVGISREVELSVDRRRYEVPCAHCGHFQRLDFFEGMRWPGRVSSETGELFPGCDLDGEDLDRRELANRVQVGQLAWYECEACGGRLEDRAHKAKMVRAGRWVSDGYAPGVHPPTRRVAFHELGLQYSQLGGSWSDMARDWILAEGETEKEFEFFTQALGLPYDRQQDTVDLRALEDRPQFQPRRVPEWATTVLMTADTQADHWYYLVRAWSADFSRSRQIDRGVVRSLPELDQIEGRVWEGEEDPERRYRIVYTGIDSGGAVDVGVDQTTTDLVYEWCRKRSRRRIALKGWGGSSRPTKSITTRPAEFQKPGRRRRAVDLHLIDTHLFQDRLAGLVGGPPERWEVARIDREFIDHMTARQRVTAFSKGGRKEERWEPVASGRRYDYHACEVYQLAMVEYARAAGRSNSEIKGGSPASASVGAKGGGKWFDARRERRAARNRGSSR